MPQQYNPIVRTFGQVRTALVSCLDVPRHEIWPETPLDTLIPINRRREVWQHLRNQGLVPPDLTLPPAMAMTLALQVFVVIVLLAWLLASGLALLLVFPLGCVVYKGSRPFAVHFPTDFPAGPRTVGELVIYLLSFKGHKCSGYRWTHNEIALKTRLIIAKQLGLSLDEVQPETTFSELGAD